VWIYICAGQKFRLVQSQQTHSNFRPGTGGFSDATASIIFPETKTKIMNRDFFFWPHLYGKHT
jgi:hypothetical protein